MDLVIKDRYDTGLEGVFLEDYKVPSHTEGPDVGFLSFIGLPSTDFWCKKVIRASSRYDLITALFDHLANPKVAYLHMIVLIYQEILWLYVSVYHTHAVVYYHEYFIILVAYSNEDQRGCL